MFIMLMFQEEAQKRSESIYVCEIVRELLLRGQPETVGQQSRCTQLSMCDKQSSILHLETLPI